MNNNVLKVAKKYRRNFIRKQVNVENVISYLSRIGYSVFFYSDTKGRHLLMEHNLEEHSEKVYALTYSTRNDKLVFVSDKISQEEKLHALLHETGHILLGHLEKRDSVQDDQMAEIQADAFVQYVLFPPKVPVMSYVSLAVICFAVSGALYAYMGAQPTEPANNTQKTEITDTAATQAPTQSPSADLVYITKTGTRYHRADCMYTKDKDCISITREEAEKRYTPCSICRP